MADDEPDAELMIRRAIAGDAAAVAWIVEQAGSTADPSVAAMAALLDGGPARIDRALTLATTTRERQVAAIAAAHLRGDDELVDVLARDHLVDHPGSVLVAWIASGGRPARS